ncbi:RasGEF domain-containing protein [Candidatus Protochlamydia amoebophila]|uniref:Ras-GEF domain-containing protein n=1 Tax=Candidatus Protochlamydia amoebophila TaxID=362787 RepID=A0A0C1H077_9BACT|nr:RasGEF domain-containing protein [Candidatus Protochlamydia amoebophila]KIC71169.1 hypothetical protein DB44_EN00060 [Candidatus Protochlamydia amoebophila]
MNNDMNPTYQVQIPTLSNIEKNLLVQHKISIKTSESTPNTGIISFGEKTFYVRLANPNLSLQSTDLEHLSGKVAIMLLNKQLLNGEFAGARINQKGIQNLEGQQIATFAEKNDPAQKMYAELCDYVSQNVFNQAPANSSASQLEETKPSSKWVKASPSSIINRDRSKVEESSPKTTVKEMNSHQQAFFETVRLAYSKISNNFAKAIQNPNQVEARQSIENELKWIDKKLKDIVNAHNFPGLEGKGVEKIAIMWAEQLDSLKIQLQDQLKAYENATSSQIADKSLYRQNFDSLISVTNELSTKQKTHKLSMKNGHPQLVERQIGLKVRKGTSETAQKTAEQVISQLKICLDQNLFYQNDIPQLENLKANLLNQLYVLDKSAKIKSEFDAVFAQIDQAKASFPRQETYIEKIETALATEGKPLTMETLVPFLLQLDQNQLRQDFLFGAGWMNFIKKDDGSNIEILSKALIDVFKKHAELEKQAKTDGNPLYALNSQVVEEKKVVLDFAVQLVKRGIVKKEAFHELLELAQKDANHTIRENLSGKYALALNSVLTTPSNSPIDVVSQMQVANPAINLSEQFSALAKGKMSSKEEKEFISAFMSDLNHASTAIFKAIQPEEFHGLKWNKGTAEDKRNNAPNITTNIAFFNQIARFVGQEILMNPTYSSKDRMRVYETFVKMADRFANGDPRNYEMTTAIIAGLNAAPVFNTMQKESISNEIKATLNKLQTLLSTDFNSKALRDTYKGLQSKATPYMPKTGVYLTDFTFLDEGNPETKSDGISLNLKKLKLLGEQQRRIENEAQALPLNQNLNFNIIGQILQSKLPSEDQLYARKEEIHPRTKAGSISQADKKKTSSEPTPQQIASFLVNHQSESTYGALKSFFNTRGNILILRDGHLFAVPSQDLKLNKYIHKQEISNALHVTAEIVFELAKKGENNIPGSTDDRLILLLSRLAGREPTKTMIENDPKLKVMFEALDNFAAFRDQIVERQKWSDFFETPTFLNAFQQLNPNHEIEIYTENSKIKAKDYQKEVIDHYRKNYAKFKADFDQIMKGDIHSESIREQLNQLEKFAKLNLYPYAEMMNDLAKELIKDNAIRNNIQMDNTEKQAIKDEFVNGKLTEIEARFKAFK